MTAAVLASPPRPHKQALPAAPVLVVLLLPMLAGCTWFDGPPKPDEEEGYRLGSQVFLAPGLDLRLDHRFGFVRVAGDVLTLPVLLDGREVGAVYLAAALRWRIDAVFQVRESSPDLQGDLFVQGPPGAWEDAREGQGWRPATQEDLQRLGGDAEAIHARAARPTPPKVTAPAEGLWSVNGTFVAQVRPENFTLALEEGPFVFQRNDTGFLMVENRTVVSWNGDERSLDASNDALARAQVRDPDLARIDLSWTRTTVDIRIVSPPFRRGDLVEDDDPISRIIAVTLPGIAEVAMTRYTSRQVDDNRVELRSQNMTLIMAPP